MATTLEPFYGCLCLETTSGTSIVPQIGARHAAGVELPEIHFNIWEKIKGINPFLDIGVMLAFNDPAENIEIFLPWKLEIVNIEDLSSRILTPTGIAAIFNEAWQVTTSITGQGGYVKRDNSSVFTVIRYQPVINTHGTANGPLHSIVLNLARLRSDSITAIGTPGLSPTHMYVRFRIKAVPPTFYRVGIDQGDAFDGGFRNRTEIIDFRMNVRRGAPPAIESQLHGRFLEFSKVHLFLMKSRDDDIVFEDNSFKSCRSLEDETFWCGYIDPHLPGVNSAAGNLKEIKGSLGYQWRKTSGSTAIGVMEFGMLARFKSLKMQKRTFAAFLAVALIIGALGNGLYDFSSWVYTHKICSSCGH